MVKKIKISSLASIVCGAGEDEYYLTLPNNRYYFVKGNGLNVASTLELLVRGTDLNELVVDCIKHNGGSLGHTTKLLSSLILDLKNHGALMLQEEFDPVPSRFDPVIDLLKCECGTASEFTQAWRTIRQAHVALIGAGSLGAPTACHLLQFGVENITIVDGDIVKPHNLAKQTVFRETDTGRLKVAALKDRLMELAPAATISTVPSFVTTEVILKEIFCDMGTVNLLVLTADEPTFLLPIWTTKFAISQGIPVVRANSMKVGAVYVPGSKFACPCCHTISREPSAFNNTRKSRLVGLCRQRSSVGNSIGPSIASAHLSQEIFSYFVSGRSSNRESIAECGGRLTSGDNTSDRECLACGR